MEEGKTVEKLGMSLDSLITRRTDTNKTQHRGGGWKPRKYEGGGGQREERRGGGGGAPHKYTTKYGGSKFGIYIIYYILYCSLYLQFELQHCLAGFERSYAQGWGGTLR